MRWLNRMIYLALGGILGLGCGDDNHSTDPQPEYGVPRARFRLDGLVRAHDSGLPLAGIRVIVKRGGQADSSLATLTNANGRWEIHEEGFPCFDDCTLLATDPDGPANGGSFADVVVTLDLEQTEPGDDRWFAGTFEQHGIEVELDPEGEAAR